MAEVVVGCLRLKDKKAVRGGKKREGKKRGQERWCKKIFGRLRVCYWWKTRQTLLCVLLCLAHRFNNAILILHLGENFSPSPKCLLTPTD